MKTHYPNNTNFALQRCPDLESRGYPPEQRRALLTTAERVQPGGWRIYQQQINAYQESCDNSAFFEAVRKWLLHDPKRRDLTEIRRLFRGPAQGADTTLQDAEPDA